MLHTRAPHRTISTNRGEFRLGQAPHVVGILNVTPDSFSDGGQLADLAEVARRAAQMEAEGASMIDIGGVSTRPGAAPVDEATELARVLPAVRVVAESTSLPISVDTYRASVMAGALDCGASLLNDVTALRGDPDMIALLADSQIPFVVMHMEGTPTNRVGDASYDDVVDHVASFLDDTLRRVEAAGLDLERCILDPGLGFDKDLQSNLNLLERLADLKRQGLPLLVGASRKRFIGELLDEKDQLKREWGTVAITAHLFAQRVEFVRVHNVRASVDVLQVLKAIAPATASEESQ